MLTSLRSRLIVGTVLGTLAVYVAADVVIYGAIRQSLLSEFDSALQTKLQTLVGLTEQQQGGVVVDLDPGQDVEFGQGRRDAGFVLLGQDGRVILSSHPLDERPWWTPADSPKSVAFLNLADGSPGRRAVAHFQARWDEHDPAARGAQKEPLTWIVWSSTLDLGAKLDRLAWLLAGTFGLTTLVSAAVLAGVIRRGLRPLRTLAGRLQTTDRDDLFMPIDIGRPPDEMRPVVERLNELLARLEASFSRERAFTADVAHELRTPLAGLIMALEVCGTRLRDPADYQQTIEQCLAAGRSMRSLVENLLTLARADARQLSAHRRPVDLEDLLRQAWRPFDSRAAARNLSVSWNVNSDVRLDSDPMLLAMVLSNLFDNAVSYADEGGRIDVELADDNGMVHLRIANSGSEVAEDDVHRVFERFWRADSARSGAGRHFGLGLALCQRIVALLNGTIRATTAKNQDFAVELRWVRAGSPEGQRTRSTVASHS
jgi:two-component system, OmpR family, heavy metal sensor histidine kinase CusS